MAFRQFGIRQRHIAKKFLQNREKGCGPLSSLSHFIAPHSHAQGLPVWDLDSQSLSEVCNHGSHEEVGSSQMHMLLSRLQLDKDSDEKNWSWRSEELLHSSTKQWSKLSGKGLLRDAITCGLARECRAQLVLPSRVRWISHSTNTSSTAAASQAATESQEDSVDKHISKQRKVEASPEECDQAVEGLTTAKAKMKQVQETRKKDETVLKKFSRIT